MRTQSVNSAQVADARKLASSSECISETVQRGSNTSQRPSTQMMHPSASSAARIASASAPVDSRVLPGAALWATPTTVVERPAGVVVGDVVAGVVGVVPAGAAVFGVVLLAAGVVGVVVAGAVVLEVVGV
jgi:hypothetical protein